MNVRKDLIFVLIIQSYFTFCVSFYDTKLIQFKRSDISMYISTTLSLCGIGLSLLFVFNTSGEKYIAKIYGAAIPTVLFGLFVFVSIFARGKTLYNKKYWIFCLSLTLPLILHNAGHLILGQSDRIMIQKMIGEEETGIYSLSVTMAMVMTTIFGSFNNAWVPYYFDSKKTGDYKSIIQKSNNYLFDITVLFMGFLLLVPEVFKIMAPEYYWNKGLLIIPFIVLAEFFRFLYLFPVNHEFYYKKTKFISIGTVLSGIINIILNFYLIRKYGTIGAAIATCISSISLFLLHLFIAKKIIGNYEYSNSFYIRGLIPVLLIFVLYFISIFYFPKLWYLRWGIGLVLGICLGIRIYKNKSLF